MGRPGHKNKDNASPFTVTRRKAENMGSKSADVKMWEISSDFAVMYNARLIAETGKVFCWPDLCRP